MSKLIGIEATPKGDALETNAAAHATRFTNELKAWTKERMPMTLSNAEFAQVSAALLISFSRQLAECAVAFGETHQVPPDEVIAMIGKLVITNYKTALDVSRQLDVGGSIQ